VTCAALHDWSTETILEVLPTWCNSKEYKTRVAFCIDSIQALNTVHTKVLRSNLGNGVAATQSCVTAIYFALKYRNQSYDFMLAQIFKLGGDADTIGAMAGAIWGAFNGCNMLDKSKIECIENSEKIVELSDSLYAASSKQSLQPTSFHNEGN
jgi:poly(ADP-ribose) glycohydrolase ARH3